MKEKTTSDDHHSLIYYKNLHPKATMAIPSTEHYLPLLYLLALQENEDTLTFFNDQVIAGSLSMTSFLLSQKR